MSALLYVSFVTEGGTHQIHTISDVSTLSWTEGTDYMTYQSKEEGGRPFLETHHFFFPDENAAGDAWAAFLGALNEGHHFNFEEWQDGQW